MLLSITKHHINHIHPNISSKKSKCFHFQAILAIALFAVVAAEPEADADAAAAYYGGYYGHPYGYYGGYRGYYGGYYGYPYRYGAYGYAHHLGKRSADAEAEADPAYLYSGAYGYPYA